MKTVAQPNSVETAPVQQRLKPLLLRNPVVFIVIPFALGIYTAEFLIPNVSSLFMGCLWLGFALCWGWFTSKNQLQWALPCLLALCFLSGFLRLQHYYQPDSQQDIAQLITEERRLIKVRGKLLTRPIVKQKRVNERAPDWQRIPSTRCHLKVTHLLSTSPERPETEVTGKLWLTVRGTEFKARRGDVVELVGWLQNSQTALNPGEFNFRTYLKRQNLSGVLRAKDPDSIRVVSSQSKTEQFWANWFSSNWTTTLIQRWQTFTAAHLSAGNQELAAAMILGVRENISYDDVEQYTQTGTMHFLAVSGLHVGILAVFLIAFGKTLRIPARWLPYMVILCIWLYAVLTDLKAPVVRASYLATFLYLGIILVRRKTLPNLLAIAALLLLMLKPTQLFEIGTQLSFSSVAGIIWGLAFFKSNAEQDMVEPSLWTHIKRDILNGYRLTFSIWIFTAPLILAQFHFLAPVGLLINVLLMPLVVVMLWLGYLMSLFLFISPIIATGVAIPFDAFLTLFRYVIELAHGQEWASFASSGPSFGWLIIYFLLLSSLAISNLYQIRFYNFSVAKLRWGLFASFLVLILGLQLLSTNKGSLRVTVLAVGHGSAIVVDYPNGKRMVYDTGSIDGGTRSAEAVQNFVWNSYHPQIDCFIASHSDTDHFNGMIQVMQKIPVGTVCFSPQFLDFTQPAVDEFVSAVESSNITTQLIQAGDQLNFDSSVETKILFPNAKTDLGDDNNHSLVVLLEHAGKQILLTGDLEQAGQKELKALLEEPLQVTMLTAPHHGALEANTAELYDLFQPQHVTVSSNSPLHAQEVQENCTSCEAVYLTQNTGSITFEITAEGNFTVTPFVEPNILKPNSDR